MTDRTEVAMRVLVAAASRHGATAQIAAEIGTALGEALRQRDSDAVVDVRAAEQVGTVAGYDAVVLGSAVYMGRWLDTARGIVESNIASLATMPVWLFSSGPIGDPPRPGLDPVDATELGRAVRARGHRVFAGKLDPPGLRFAERAAVLALQAPDGDFRDWPAIRAWATGLAEALLREPNPTTPS